MLSDFFITNILPHLIDIGKIVFWVSAVGGLYHITRMKTTEGIERVRAAAMGYIGLKLLTSFVEFVDKITDGIKFTG